MCEMTDNETSRGSHGFLYSLKNLCRAAVNDVVILWKAFLLAIPGETGAYLRSKLIPFGAIGKNTFIYRGSKFKHEKNIHIGDNCQIGYGSFINGAETITIGNDVLIGPEVFIWTQNHTYEDPDMPIREQGWTYKPVTIEDDVWIGAKTMVLPGVTIGQGAVVGTSSVVTRDLEPYGVYFGNPARKIGSRKAT